MERESKRRTERNIIKEAVRESKRKETGQSEWQGKKRSMRREK